MGSEWGVTGKPSAVEAGRLGGHSPLLGLEPGSGVPGDEEEGSHRMHVTQR